MKRKRCVNGYRKENENETGLSDDRAVVDAILKE